MGMIKAEVRRIGRWTYRVEVLMQKWPAVGDWPVGWHDVGSAHVLGYKRAVKRAHRIGLRAQRVEERRSHVTTIPLCT